MGAKSDILRYEVLHQYGGLYVDTDFECLKAFDDIHHMCNFYAGLLNSPSPRILIGLIGCAPQDKIIKKNIEQINIASKKHTPDEIFTATGPLHFTRCFFDEIKSETLGRVIFPSSFFYPSPNFNSGVEDSLQKKYARDESYAVHYWYISWTKNKKTIAVLLKKLIKHLLPYGLVKLYSHPKKNDQ